MSFDCSEYVFRLQRVCHLLHHACALCKQCNSWYYYTTHYNTPQPTSAPPEWKPRCTRRSCLSTTSPGALDHSLEALQPNGLVSPSPTSPICPFFLVSTCVCVRFCACAYKRARARVCACACAGVFVLNVFACVCARVCIYTHLYMYVYIYVYVCMYVCMYIYSVDQV